MDERFIIKDYDELLGIFHSESLFTLAGDKMAHFIVVFSPPFCKCVTELCKVVPALWSPQHRFHLYRSCLLHSWRKCCSRAGNSLERQCVL